MTDSIITDYPNANMQYRNSVFCSYFNEPTRLLSLCNAILGTDYSDANELEINTLETSMLSNQKNDISCKIRDNFLILIEHQSSVNNNMPFRCLSYIAKLLDNLIDDRAKLYRKTLIKFPAPRFVVLYDGNDSEPLHREMRLSDAFNGDSSSLELIVNSFNINYGLNHPLLDKCRYLKDYSTLVGKVKEGFVNGLSLHDSIIQAVNFCVDHNIMKQFLLDNEREVFNMLALQWKLEDAQKAWFLEGRDEGIDIGIEKVALNMLKKNKSFKDIQEATDLSIKRIQELANSIKN